MSLTTRFQKAYRHVLRLIFKFDKWHTSPLAERTYAKAIVGFLNSRPSESRNKIAEIGCGLGDILARVRYAHKEGFDLDGNVLKACNFIRNTFNTSKIKLAVFKFPDDSLAGRDYDAILLVNWIHHIPPHVLQSKIKEMFENNLKLDGVLVLDTVQDKAYRYNHSIADISDGLNCRVEKIGDFEREREVFGLIKLS